MLNGLGGSADFLRNAKLSIMHTPSAYVLSSRLAITKERYQCGFFGIGGLPSLILRVSAVLYRLLRILIRRVRSFFHCPITLSLFHSNILILLCPSQFISSIRDPPATRPPTYLPPIPHSFHRSTQQQSTTWT
jgi:hypothetical protein